MAVTANRPKKHNTQVESNWALPKNGSWAKEANTTARETSSQEEVKSYPRAFPPGEPEDPATRLKHTIHPRTGVSLPCQAPRNDLPGPEV